MFLQFPESLGKTGCQLTDSLNQVRFGIDQQREYTLEEIGLNFDVTRERIRQIEAKAISRLRHPSRKHFISS